MVTHEGFDFPDDLYYTEDQIWVKKENGKVRLGFTTFGMDLAGKIKFVRLRPDLNTAGHRPPAQDQRGGFQNSSQTSRQL